ncbi:MAG: glycosyltransferase family 4 protein [Candidatus Eisenbacteria bacterium]
MRRALIVTDSLVWTAETEYAVTVAGAESGMGAGVTFAAPAESPVSGRLGEGVEFLELPGASPSSSIADFVADARFLSGLVRRGGYDVVHSSRPTAHILTTLACGGRVPLVHLRGSASAPSGHAANRLLYGAATAVVIASSSRVKNWVEERLGVPADRVHRLLAPVAPSWFEQPSRPGDAVDKLGLPPGAPIVLNVARLAPIKGHGVLLEAMARVVAAGTDAVLLLVGEPWSGQPEGLKSQALRLGIQDRVFFAGRREDVRELVGASAVCVTSSIGSEENSRAVGEYMAAARPVVATNVGVIPELVVDGETGFVVPPSDPARMSDAILRLLEDGALARRMGAGGREVAKSLLSPDAFVRGLEGALQNAGAGR